MLTGCLVEDPPPLERAKQTPPRLDHQGARPLLDQIIIATGNKPVEFSIPVTSEDAGEGLVGYLFLDYVSGENVGTFMAVPSNLAPSTLDDDSIREFKFTWLVPKEVEGCHRVTLLAGHVSTFFDLKNITNTADLAVAYWWANVNPTPENASVLRDCPAASRGNSQGQ
jgi:hypothetical protein